MSEVEKKQEHHHRKVLQGMVVSDKMQKTIVVKVNRRVRHEEYKKYITVSKKYKVHDQKQQAKTGDRVEIIESRPLSRQKRWALRKVIQQANLAASEVVA